GVVPVFVGMALLTPSGDRVRRRSNGRQSIGLRNAGHRCPEERELGSGFGRTGADLGRNLDLRALEFFAEVVTQRSLAFREQLPGRLGHELAGTRFEEEISLLNAERVGRLMANCHGATSETSTGSD